MREYLDRVTLVLMISVRAFVELNTLIMVEAV